VVRTGRALEILQVTTDARRVGTGQVVVAVYVALCALDRSVRSRKGKAGRGMVEIRARPGRGVMALGTGLREVRLHVVRIGGALEVF